MPTVTTQEQARQLKEGLGSIYIDKLLNTPEGVVSSIIRGNKAATASQAKLIDVAHETLTLIAKHEGWDVARLWFLGTNSRLDISQLEAFHRREFDAVRDCAKGLINDTPGSAI